MIEYHKRKTSISNLVLGFLLIVLSTSAGSSELTYRPVNPNFGGNALNGNSLLSNAQAQNDFTDDKRSSSSGYKRPTQLERLSSSLQSRLVSQLISDVGDGRSGSLSTDQFNMLVTDDGAGGLDVSITDKVTGETTTISINGLLPD